MRTPIRIAAGAAVVCGLTSSQPLAETVSRHPEISGVASYYDKNYHGKTASGAFYDANKLTAAHRSLPFGTRLTVLDPLSHRVVTVVVNDRGPFTKGRVLDLSYSAAQALHMTGRGVMKVTFAIE
jgi:peptidoglycan lytic transglycosylase